MIIKSIKQLSILLILSTFIFGNTILAKNTKHKYKLIRGKGNNTDIDDRIYAKYDKEFIVKNDLIYEKESKLLFTGIMHGYYHDGKVKEFEISCKDGKLDGKFIKYNYRNNLKEYETWYKNGKENGKSTHWYETGHKAYEKFYKNGVLDGSSTSWYYENGNKKEASTYKNGIYDGKVTRWYKNGKKSFFTFYKNGVYNGKHIMWDEKGNKIVEEFYKNGEKDTSAKANNHKNIKKRIYNPVIASNYNFSAKKKNTYNKNQIYCEKLKKIKNNKLSEKQKKDISNCNDIPLGYYSIEKEYNDCMESRVYKIFASHYLKPQGKNNYKPYYLYNFDLEGAWATTGGVGEYIIYKLHGGQDITHINIANGYVKDKKTWKNNSRVKKLKVYLNGKFFAILNLKDTQFNSFAIDEIKTNIDGIEIRFEILEIYKGDKYNDIAISEIYFNRDVRCCFTKGTKISTLKSNIAIENLKIGDKILTYDMKTKKIKETTIKKLAKQKHNNIVTYTFKDGKSVTTTTDHPFMIESKGWSSLTPKISKNYKGMKEIKKIKTGDQFKFFTKDNKITTNKLINIKYLNTEKMTYTISELSSGNNFIANGFLVSVEKIKK